MAPAPLPQDRDESSNFAQRYDAELVKEELRPIVFEETRLQVDEEMRVLLQVRAQAAAGCCYCERHF